MISLPSNTVCHGRDLEGDEAIKIMGALDGDKIAKSIWEKLSAYTRRALIEID